VTWRQWCKSERPCGVAGSKPTLVHWTCCISMGEETSAEEKLRLKSRKGCQAQHTYPSPLSRPHLASFQLCWLSDGWSLDEVPRELQAGRPPSDRNLSVWQPPWVWRLPFLYLSSGTGDQRVQPSKCIIIIIMFQFRRRQMCRYERGPIFKRFFRTVQ
jgi:hypothetical protein